MPTITAIGFFVNENSVTGKDVEGKWLGILTLEKNMGYIIRVKYMKRKKEIIKMKIAVTYDHGQIFQHFGHTEQFKVYETKDSKIISSKVMDTNGNGHGALAGFLENEKVDVLICGGIGMGAVQALEECGIQLVGGASGDADAQVEAFLQGDLVNDPSVKCNHHHEEGHDCGNHHDHECGHHCH